MISESERPRRRSIRLPDYDYAQAGAYFVTIVTKDRACLFGEIVGGEMRLNGFGRIVQAVWDGLPSHYPGVECDEFVVMPNHVHGILLLNVGAGFKSALTGMPPYTAATRAGFKPAPTSHRLPEIVRGFKSFSARAVNAARGTLGVPVWQRNYYEHVVRGEAELNCIREYIASNPLQWEIDRENPNRNVVKSAGKSEPWEV